MTHTIRVIICLAIVTLTPHTYGGEPEGSLFNFQTGQYDTRLQAPSTDTEAVQYIWQNASAQGLYRVYRAMGCDVRDAMTQVLKAQARIEDTTPCVEEKN